MRRVWVGFGFVLVAAVGVGLSTTRTVGQPAGAAADANHKKITVTGTGTVSVKPDTARVSFAVKGSGVDFKAAVADCDKQAAAVKKAVEDLKLGGLEIKSGPINIVRLSPAFPMPPGVPPPIPGGVPPLPVNPNNPGAAAARDGVNPFLAAAQPIPGAAPAQPAPGLVPPGGFGGQPFPGGPPGFIGPGGPTEVSRTFTVVATFGGQGGAGELKDIVPVADKILTAAVTAGATEAPVFNANPNPYGGLGVPYSNPAGGNTRVEFHRSNLAQLRQEALKLAVADAVANAKAAAGVANLTAKDIVSLTDQNPFGGFGLPGQAMNTGRGEVIGEQELTVQVSVTFGY